jgi:hypothetical protein
MFDIGDTLAKFELNMPLNLRSLNVIASESAFANGITTQDCTCYYDCTGSIPTQQQSSVDKREC